MKTAPIARFSPCVTSSPNSGKTAICVMTATPYPAAAFAAASGSDMTRDGFMPQPFGEGDILALQARGPR